MIPFHTNDCHKKTSHIIIITRIDIFVVINQINKDKVKIYNHYTYTQIITKKTYFSIYIYFFFFVKYKNDKAIIRQAKTNGTN